jgi:hypothetical protein
MRRDSGCRRDNASKHRDQPPRQPASLERAKLDLRGCVAVWLRRVNVKVDVRRYRVPRSRLLVVRFVARQLARLVDSTLD